MVYLIIGLILLLLLNSFVFFKVVKASKIFTDCFSRQHLLEQAHMKINNEIKDYLNVLKDRFKENEHLFNEVKKEVQDKEDKSHILKIESDLNQKIENTLKSVGEHTKAINNIIKEINNLNA